MPKQISSILDMATNVIKNLGTPTAADHAAPKGYVDAQISGVSAGGIISGSIVMYAGTAAPANWLLCNGGTFSSLTYPTLATVVGDTYGVHSGTTYFLPDLRSRVPWGTGTYAALGVGDALTEISRDIRHTHPIPHSHNMPHTHDITHGEVANTGIGGTAVRVNAVNATTGGVSTPATAGSNTIATSLDSTDALPYLSLNFIIKV